MISVYVPDNVPENYVKGFQKRLRFVDALPEIYLQIEKNVPCACDTQDRFVVQHTSIILPKDVSPVISYPCYAMPEESTHEELYTLITWLLQNQFKTFRNRIVHHVLVRDFAYRPLLDPTPQFNCCTRYTLKEFPIFFMDDIVVSLYGAGPTVESVCKKSHD